MKQDEVDKILEQRLNAAYAGGVAVYFANAPTQRPADAGRFAHFYVDTINSNNVMLGQKSRNTGMIIIELFVPLGEGERTGVGQAEEFGDVFRNQDFSGVMCYERVISKVGPVALDNEDFRRYKITVSIPFYYDRTA